MHSPPRLEMLSLAQTDESFLAEYSPLLGKAVVTVLVIATVLVARAWSQRSIQSTEWRSDEERVRWHLRANQVAALAIFLLLLFVWAAELQSAALSAVAIAAAIVIATKELILCMAGSLVRALSRSYGIGDRVELGGFRGDVVDYGLLTTTIHEAGPTHQRTGRMVTVPNSVLLNQSVVNETFADEYVLHSFPIHLKREDEWQRARELVLQAAERCSAEYVQPARRHIREAALEQGFTPPTVDARVSVKVPEAGKVDLLVRFPTPARLKGRIEQEILLELLDAMDEWVPADGPPASP